MLQIKELSKLIEEMVVNYHTFDCIWKNIELGKRCFVLMKGLPSTLEGEFDTPAEKAILLSKMLDLMDEESTPRFCIEVREYIKSLYPDYKENTNQLVRLKDYINPDMTMEEYCCKYNKYLKFDSVQREQKWEDIIYHVEKKCDEILKGEPRRMGFCFSYWHAKSIVLQDYGIDWRSPAVMNPGVMFD